MEKKLILAYLEVYGGENVSCLEQIASIFNPHPRLPFFDIRSTMDDSRDNSLQKSQQYSKLKRRPWPPSVLREQDSLRSCTIMRIKCATLIRKQIHFSQGYYATKFQAIRASPWPYPLFEYIPVLKSSNTEKKGGLVKRFY